MDMDQPQIYNERPVQGQNIAQQQWITQHFHGVEDRATSPAKPYRIWNVPFPHNPFFTGREELLAQLRARFRASRTTGFPQPQAVSGLGGIGKTQIAVEYAHQYCQDYQAVLWAYAENKETLISSYLDIAVLLQLPEREAQQQEAIVQAVKRWL